MTATKFTATYYTVDDQHSNTIAWAEREFPANAPGEVPWKYVELMKDPYGPEKGGFVVLVWSGWKWPETDSDTECVEATDCRTLEQARLIFHETMWRVLG